MAETCQGCGIMRDVEQHCAKRAMVAVGDVFRLLVLGRVDSLKMTANSSSITPSNSGYSVNPQKGNHGCQIFEQLKRSGMAWVMPDQPCEVDAHAVIPVFGQSGQVHVFNFNLPCIRSSFHRSPH